MKKHHVFCTVLLLLLLLLCARHILQNFAVKYNLAENLFPKTPVTPTCTRDHALALPLQPEKYESPKQKRI